MAGIEDRLPIDLDFLKRHRIDVYATGSPLPIDHFSIYSGIVFEANRGNRLSCLIDGDWYNISQSHVGEVNARLKLITKSTIALPDANTNEKEGDYNIRATKALKASCMDKKLIPYGSGGKIEVCDLLTNAPCFIHVKKASSSQVLSHLFNQGVVAGQFLLDEDFRKECIKKADAGYKQFFLAPYAASKVTITFGIISKRADKLPEKLPFFSKQTLINAADLLRKFNYKVELRGIKIV